MIRPPPNSTPSPPTPLSRSLAAVPADQFHKLRRAAAPRFPVVHARDWDDALATIRTRPVELAAVDPQHEGSPRSEEHTSELQSPCNLVCRLLLEKKKTRDAD